MKRIPRVFGDADALDYVDGRQDERRRSAFASHIAEHPAEAERVAMWIRQNQVLQATFASVLQESLPISLRLNRAIPAEPRVTSLRSDRPASLHAFPPLADARTVGRQAVEPTHPETKANQGTRLAIRVPIALIAPVLAAGLILVAIHALLSGEQAVPIAPSKMGSATNMARATEAYDTYAVDPSHPVEFTPAQMTVFDRWIQGRLGLAVIPADLRTEGWSLLGARLVPGAGAPAAFFIYEDQAGDRLGLYVTRATAPGGAPTMSLPAEHAEDASIGWNGKDGLSYVVTVGKSLDWLSRNAETLRAKVGLAPN